MEICGSEVSCGVGQIADITWSHNTKTPRQVLIWFLSNFNYDYYYGDTRSNTKRLADIRAKTPEDWEKSLKAFYVFSDNMLKPEDSKARSQGHGPDDEDDEDYYDEYDDGKVLMGQTLADFIREKELGGILETEERKNHNSGNKIRVWVWTPDFKALTKFAKSLKTKEFNKVIDGEDDPW